MQQIVGILRGYPPLLLIAAGVLAVLLGIVVVWLTVLRRLFRNTLETVIASPELAETRIRGRHRPAAILLHSRLIEKLAREQDRSVVRLSGIDQLWIERLARRHRTRDAARVMEFAPDSGLFTCFVAALHRRRIASMLRQWLDRSDRLLPLRSVALSGRGEAFDGRAAHRLLSDRLDEVREMVGDPEWPVRYFATKIILHDDGVRSERVLWACFEDAHRLVRRTVAAEFQHPDRKALYGKLHHLYLHDPVFEVRRQARQRIAVDFPELYRAQAGKLSDVEAFHVIELLQPNSTEDEAVAFRYLAHENLELRLPAAIYLQQIDALERLFRRVNIGDREDFARIEQLLRNACAVNVSEFLASANLDNPGSLMLAARLLGTAGPASSLLAVARRIFELRGDEAVHWEMLRAVLDAIQSRGREDVLELTRRQLVGWKHDAQRAELILQRIPPRAAAIFASTLLELVQDPTIAARAAVERAIVALPSESVLPALLQILREGREHHPHIVRMSALRIIGELKLSFCLQFLIENLATLPPEDARQFTGVIASFAGKEFDERALELLSGPDAITRAALIASLPATGNKDYLKPIREAVGDADPDVRIAAVWALQLFGDSRSLNQIHELLRDPVERVRREAATVLGMQGTPSVLQRVQAVLRDDNEVDTVKLSAIRGLGASQATRSIALLVEILAAGDDWDDAIVEALASRRTRKQVEALLEQIKDSEPRLRAKLSRVFHLMGSDGEEAMVELLQEEIASLRPYVTGVLEELGFVEATIRRLAHRDPAVRRAAAHRLSIVGTRSAFRGIVMAARDPDSEVRVLVTRAIDRLLSDAGKEILEELQNDPDRRVRKYTLWAIERQKSKSL